MRDVPLEDSIYEAAVVPELWPVVLARLSTLAEAAGGVAFCIGERGPRWTTSPNFVGDMERFVREGWLERNSRVAFGGRAGLIGAHRFLTDEDLFGTHDYTVEPIYRDYFLPLGLGRSAGSTMVLPHGDVLVVSVEKDWRTGPVGSEALADLDRLFPHLMRAAMVAGRLAFERARSAVDTLAKLGMPAVAVDASGRVLVGSPLWDVQAEDWTTGARDRLVLHDPRARVQLADALDPAALAANRVGSIAVRRPSGDRAVLHVLPIRRTAHDMFDRCAALVILSKPREGALASPLLVQALFDLTPAEAIIAVEVARGHAPKQIARTTGKSVETVRNQIKAVMHKTGTTRSVELASLLVDIARHAPSDG